MKLAIMQPYFMPYLGYWQLINSVDTFVIYDNIEYTKKGYITRNNYLCNGVAKQFSLSLKKDSDYLNVCDRVLSDNFDRKKMLNQINESYKKAPYFEVVFGVVKDIILFDDINLFKYILNSVQTICEYLDIKTTLLVSSKIDINHDLKGQEKVLAICNELKCNTYINAIGGQSLYSYSEFNKNSIKLNFIKIGDIKYRQFNNDFVPFLSILDLLMFNSKDEIKIMLTDFELIGEFNYE